MGVPVWAASPWRGNEESLSVVSLLEVTLTGQHLRVKDSEIGEVYLDTHVYSPDIFSLAVKFDANGVKSVEVVR
jgi:hypothetical protein